jgi:hypothetical protein
MRHCDCFATRDEACEYVNENAARFVVSASDPTRDLGHFYMGRCTCGSGWAVYDRLLSEGGVGALHPVELPPRVRRLAASEHDERLRNMLATGCVASKNIYANREQALACASWSAFENGCALSVYLCQFCGHWHITSTRCVDPTRGYVDREHQFACVIVDGHNEAVRWRRRFKNPTQLVSTIHDNFVSQCSSPEEGERLWKPLAKRFERVDVAGQAHIATHTSRNSHKRVHDDVIHSSQLSCTRGDRRRLGPKRKGRDRSAALHADGDRDVLDVISSTHLSSMSMDDVLDAFGDC